MEADYLPIPIDTLAGWDLSEIEAKAVVAAEALRKEKEILEQKQAPQGAIATSAEAGEETDKTEKHGTATSEESESGVLVDVNSNSADKDSAGDSSERESEDGSDESDDGGGGDESSEKPAESGQDDESLYESDFEGTNVVYLGLRVYTNKESPAKIGGQLRHETGTNYHGLASGRLY